MKVGEVGARQDIEIRIKSGRNHFGERSRLLLRRRLLGCRLGSFGSCLVGRSFFRCCLFGSCLVSRSLSLFGSCIFGRSLCYRHHHISYTGGRE